jgi:endonuclease/exonuclease/phosphatase family metal-dependent hydrolase
LWLIGSALALVRLIEQINPNPTTDMLLASIGVVLLIWFLPISFNTLRGAQAGRHFPTALLLGIAIDTTLKGIFGTIDLSWLNGLLSLSIVAALVALSLWLLIKLKEDDAPPTRTASPVLLALGPFLFLQAQVFQNIGFTSVVTGWSLPLAVEMIVVANVIGIALNSILYGRLPRRAWTGTIIVGLILLVVSLPLEGDPLAGLELMTGNIAAAIGLTVVTQAEGSHRAQWLMPFAVLLTFLLVVIYYVGYIYPLPVEQRAVAPLAALMLMSAMILSVPRFAQRPQPLGPVDWTPGVIGLGLIAIMIIPWLTRHEPVGEPSGFPARVMSYNLHSGFDVTGRLDLEAIAQTIEQEQADVIALQEVSRGWVIDGSVDMAAWLSQRLNLPYVWAPTAYALWGNALFSRYPIREVHLQPMPNNAEVRPHRGFIDATLEVGGRTLNVIVTHLDHTDGAKRLPQVQALIAAWANRPATMLMGDLNAEPLDQEINLLRKAGLIDSFAEAGQGNGFTYYSTRPDRRIDYVLHTVDLTASDFRVNPSTASDHRAVAVTIAAK